MKEIKTTADIANATAIDLGPLAEIKDYVLELGPDVKIPGKVFGGAAVKAGGADFSLQVFAPGTEGGFYHTHNEHEELYFFPSATRVRRRSQCSASSTSPPRRAASRPQTERSSPSRSSGRRVENRATTSLLNGN